MENVRCYAKEFYSKEVMHFIFGQQAIVNYYLEYVCYFRRDFMMQEIRLVYPHY